jgi:hypothetical protein
MLIFGVEKKYFIVCLTLTIIICCVIVNGKQGPYIELYDYWEHAASINELSKNIFHPGNPLLQTPEANTLRYTPYIFLAAVLKSLFRLDLFTTIKFLSICSFVVFLSGVYLWSKEYFRDQTIPLYVLTVFLFFWGELFNYSNEYGLRFLSYTLFYPSIFSFNLSFLGFYFVTKYARTGRTLFFVHPIHSTKPPVSCPPRISGMGTHLPPWLIWNPCGNRTFRDLVLSIVGLG